MPKTDKKRSYCETHTLGMEEAPGPSQDDVYNDAFPVIFLSTVIFINHTQSTSFIFQRPPSKTKPLTFPWWGIYIYRLKDLQVGFSTAIILLHLQRETVFLLTWPHMIHWLKGLKRNPSFITPILYGPISIQLFNYCHISKHATCIDVDFLVANLCNKYPEK